MQENTGNGVKESTMEKSATAASSKTSPKNGKRSTRSTRQPITPEEALELLTSALSYCQQSGLSVTGYSRTEGVILFIKGVAHVGSGFVVTPSKPAQQSNDNSNDKKEQVTA